MLGIFRLQTATREVRRIQFQVKMPQNRRNKLFTSKQTTNKAPSNILTGFKFGTKVRMIFSKHKHNTKGLWNIFSR